MKIVMWVSQHQIEPSALKRKMFVVIFMTEAANPLNPDSVNADV